jgi:hypothetical protein
MRDHVGADVSPPELLLLGPPLPDPVPLPLLLPEPPLPPDEPLLDAPLTPPFFATNRWWQQRRTLAFNLRNHCETDNGERASRALEDRA